jgi:hypothetical protein
MSRFKGLAEIVKLMVVDAIEGRCGQCHVKDYSSVVETLENVNLVTFDGSYSAPVLSTYHKTCNQCGYEWNSVFD